MGDRHFSTNIHQLHTNFPNSDNFQSLTMTIDPHFSEHSQERDGGVCQRAVSVENH